MVTRGELDVEMVTETYNGEDTVADNAKTEMATIYGGELLIIPKAHWHRIILKKETDLVVTTFKGNSKLAALNNVLSKLEMSA